MNVILKFYILSICITQYLQSWKKLLQYSIGTMYTKKDLSKKLSTSKTGIATKKLIKIDNNCMQLSNLKDSVEKSKLGVENINNFQKDERMFSAKLQKLQEQLKQVVIETTNEVKKNKIFCDLIEILKREMSEIEQYQTQEIQKQQGQIAKKAKSLKVQIDRICHKRNQQVANIRELRELASAARGQRVIYSNLFKKIQKQIKQNQELYRNQIIQTQQTKKQLQMAKKSKIHNLSQTNCKTQSQQINDNEDNCFGEKQILTMKQSSGLVNLQPKSPICQFKQSWKTREKRSDLSTHCREKAYKRIHTYQQCCEQIRAKTGYNDKTEIIQHFSSLSSKNDELFTQIDKMQEEIQAILKQTQKLQKQKASSHLSTQNNSYKIQRKSAQQISVQKQNSYQGIFNQILDCFQIKIHYQNRSIINEKSRLIDQLIEKGSMIDMGCRQDVDQDKKDVNGLDIVFQRMQMFQQCEKLMDKGMFKNEYSKEINKKKYRTKKL